MTKDTHVLIAGGGIGGLTLAALLRRVGIQCKVLERSQTIQPVGAGLSLAPNALRVLDQLGIYEYIRREGQPLRRIRIYRNKTAWNDIDFRWIENVFGYPVYSIERHAFHHRLYEAAGGDETVILGAEVVDLITDPDQADGVTVRLADGRTFTADVLVGADGVRSVVRRLMSRQAGLEAVNTIQFTGRVHMSGYTAPLSHLGPTEEGTGTWMLYDKSILTTWPCKDNRQWFIGVMPSQLKEADRSVWKHADQQTINEVYGDHYHPFAPSTKFRDIVDKAERVVASDVFHETGFPTMAAGRIALLGDAAHAMTSFFGQGACQAIEDATELANALSAVYKVDTKDPRSPSIEKTLQNYRKSREGRAKNLVHFSDRYAMLHTARLPYGMGPLVRRFVYTWMPRFAWKWSLNWLYSYQPSLNIPNNV